MCGNLLVQNTFPNILCEVKALNNTHGIQKGARGSAQLQPAEETETDGPIPSKERITSYVLRTVT